MLFQGADVAISDKKYSGGSKQTWRSRSVFPTVRLIHTNPPNFPRKLLSKMSAERICTLCKVTTSTRFRLLSKGKWSELTRNHTVELTWKEVCFNHLIVDMVTNHLDSLSDCPVETVRSIIRRRTAKFSTAEQLQKEAQQQHENAFENSLWSPSTILIHWSNYLSFPRSVLYGY